MTGLGITIGIAAVLVLLLVIGMTWLALRNRLGDQAASWQRKRADKGKVKCYYREKIPLAEDSNGKARVVFETPQCKNKAGWVTPRGYFCEEHWEINARLLLADGSQSRVRWAHQLVWRKKGTDVWTT